MMRTRLPLRIYGLTVLIALLVGACSPGVQGKIFYDANQNGLMDSNESATGMAGVPVELYEVVSTTTKKITKTTSTAKSAVTTNATLLGSKAAVVAKDANEDSKESSGDTQSDEKPPVTNQSSQVATITVPAASGTLVASATTDRYGHFEFYGVGAGEYEVRVTDAYGPLTLGYRVTSQKNPISVRSVMSPAKANLGIYRQGLRVIGDDCASKLSAAGAGACTVTLRNESPVIMQNVAVTVQVPRELLVMPNAGGLFYAGTNEVQWTWAEVQPQATVQASMQLLPNMDFAANGASVALSWRVSSDGQLTEENLAGTPPPSLSINLAPDIQLSLLAPTLVAAGTPFTVELQHRYNQLVPIPNAALTLTLPEEVIVVKAAQGDWDSTANTVRWELGTLQSGVQSHYLVLKVKVPLAEDILLQLAAELDAMGLDAPKTSSTQVLARPDASVTMTATLMTPVVVAKQYAEVPSGEWHIRITQTGKNVVTGAKLVATYDADLLLTGSGNLNSAARTMTWELPPLQPNMPQQIQLLGKPIKSSIVGLTPYRMTFALIVPDLVEPIERQADLQVHIVE